MATKNPLSMPQIKLIQNTDLKRQLCEAKLSLTFYQGEDCFIMKCPELDLTTFGFTFAHAYKNIGEMINFFIEDGLESGQLYQWLDELGWTITDSTIEYHGSLTQSVEYTNAVKDQQTIALPTKQIIAPEYA